MNISQCTKNICKSAYKSASSVAGKISEARYGMVPFAIPSHLRGDLSCTGSAIRRRYVANTEKAGKLSEIPADLYEHVAKQNERLDKEFNGLIMGTLRRKTWYRGIIGDDNEGVKILKNAQIGEKVIPDTGYAFVSGQKSVGRGYASYVGGITNDDCVLMKIKIPFWSKISRNPWHLSEAVLPRNAEFVVLDKKKTDGVLEVMLKYIKPKG